MPECMGDALGTSTSAWGDFFWGYYEALLDSKHLGGILHDQFQARSNEIRGSQPT